MKDNPYFKIEATLPFTPSPLESNELFRGPYWSVYLENETYVLSYISGELFGQFRRLEISEAEARQLMHGEISCENLLITHDSS